MENPLVGKQLVSQHTSKMHQRKYPQNGKGVLWYCLTRLRTVQALVGEGEVHDWQHTRSLVNYSSKIHPRKSLQIWRKRGYGGIPLAPFPISN